jgi:hypothetical protein
MGDKGKKDKEKGRKQKEVKGDHNTKAKRAKQEKMLPKPKA